MSELQDARGWVEDAPGWSLGLSWGFSLDAARVTSRMLEDGSRMPQDDLKDHLGEFSWMRRE